MGSSPDWVLVPKQTAEFALRLIKGNFPEALRLRAAQLMKVATVEEFESEARVLRQALGIPVPVAVISGGRLYCATTVCSPPSRYDGDPMEPAGEPVYSGPVRTHCTQCLTGLMVEHLPFGLEPKS